MTVRICIVLFILFGGATIQASTLCLEWQANPQNQHVDGYKIYELHIAQTELLERVSGDGVTQYFISGVLFNTYKAESKLLVEHVDQLPDGFPEGADVDHCFDIEHESVTRYGFYVIGYDMFDRKSGPSNVVYCDQECIDYFAKKPPKVTGVGLEPSDNRGR
jgi:hypothetical protein